MLDSALIFYMSQRFEQEGGFDYVSLASDYYDYQPLSDSRVDFNGNSRFIDLGIDWEQTIESAEKIAAQFVELFKAESKIAPNSRTICNSRYRVEFPEINTKIRSGNNKLNLLIRKRIVSDDEIPEMEKESELMTLAFDINGNMGQIDRTATLCLVRKGAIWKLQHRLVKPRYRGQKLGKLLMKILEKCLSELALESGREQTLVTNVGQLNVLDWFLKNGFEIEKYDREKFSRLLSGDPQFVIKSAQKDLCAECPRQWYIFEKEIYEKFGELIWRIDQGKGHLRYSTRFNLSKKIEAEYDDIPIHKEVLATRLSAALVFP